MKDQKDLKQEEGMNPMVAAVAGAVVGAGIAVAGVALADKKNRDKIIETATKAKALTKKYINGIEKQVENKKNDVEKEISGNKEKMRKVVASAKNSFHKTANVVNKAVQTI